MRTLAAALSLFVVGLAVPSRAAQDARPSFADFLAGIRTEAIERGIRPEVLDQALADIQEPVQSVIERDRSQAETVLTLEMYLSRRLTPTLVKSGREAAEKNRQLLDEISAHYGVPTDIIVGIWGFESNFGSFSGVRPTVAALATLAWDPRRSSLFRRELLAALEILNRGDIEFSELRGSWAGAMGQLQFIPSSYLKFAEDYDGDGRRDIWSSLPDIFASVGNYLRGNGWIAGQSWGREVQVPAEAAGQIAGSIARRTGGCQAKRDMTVALPTAEWQRLGVRQLDGKSLPDDWPDASLVSGTSRFFLVQHNYDALLEYNCSHSYAIGVGLLAGRVSGADPSPAPKTAARKKPAAPKKKRSTRVARK
jgi:membrane-bound lytic murein transglycosylase B